MTDFWTEVAWTVGLSHVLIVVILLHDNPSRLRRWARWLAGCIVPGSAILYAIALVAALTIAPYAEGRFIIRKVSAGTSYIIDGEDFSETGIPTANTWTENNAPNSWDSTAHSTLTGQALAMIDAGDDVEVALGSLTTVWVAFQIESGLTLNNATSFFGLRAAAGTGGSVIILQPTGNRAQFFANGSTLHTSTSFAFVNDTKYYVWLRYQSGGTTGVYISTTTTRPTAPADTSTTYAREVTDTATLTITKLSLRAQASTTDSYFLDDLYADDAEITNPW